MGLLAYGGVNSQLNLVWGEEGKGREWWRGGGGKGGQKPKRWLCP